MSGTITIRGNTCAREPDVIQFGASVEVGLEEAQAIRITFLPDLDGLQFSRTRTWSCGEWSLVDFDRGCARDLGQPITQLVTVTEVNRVEVGTIPPRFDYAMVSSITDVIAPMQDLDNVIVTEECD